MRAPDPILTLSQFLANLPTLLAVLLAWMHSNGRFNDLNSRLNSDTAATNRRIDDTRGLFRSEFRRVEEVMDTRLKHLEERER